MYEVSRKERASSKNVTETQNLTFSWGQHNRCEEGLFIPLTIDLIIHDFV